MAVGLVFPNLRTWLALRRYERDLNKLVARADREVSRLDVAYLLNPERAAQVAPPLPHDEPVPSDPDRRRVH
jgi:hypothetical protein